MDAADEPSAWRDFGVALVGTSAALLGLVFVVVSLHPGLGLLVHALGGAHLVAAGVVLGVLSAMLAMINRAVLQDDAGILRVAEASYLAKAVNTSRS